MKKYDYLILNSSSNYEIPNVYEFKTIEEEVNNVCIKIRQLLDKNVELNHIKLICDKYDDILLYELIESLNTIQNNVKLSNNSSIIFLTSILRYSDLKFKKDNLSIDFLTKLASSEEIINFLTQNFLTSESVQKMNNNNFSLNDALNNFQYDILRFPVLFKDDENEKTLNLIIKCDVQGSIEAIRGLLEKINIEGTSINIISARVGGITNNDIILALASHAIIIGFNVRPNAKTLEVAKEYNVDIRLYNIIYKLVEEMESAMKGMLDPEYEEKVIGSAEVRKLFKFSKVGTIAGCMVTDGVVRSNAKARLIRDGVVVYDGAINTIQKEKDQAKEVKKGFECGITLENYNDIKEKDVIEAYEMVEIKR